MMTSALWGRLHRKARALVMIQVCLGLEKVEGRQGDQLVDSRGLPAQLPLCCHSCQSEGVPGTVSLRRAPGSSTQSARTRPDYYIYVPWHQTESILTMASSGDCTYPGIGGLAALAHGVHMPIEGASRRPHGHPASDQAQDLEAGGFLDEQDVQGGPEEEELPDAVKAPSQCGMGLGWGGVGGCRGCVDRAAGGGGGGGARRVSPWGASANQLPTGKRDYPVNMLPFSYPITLYSRILLPCCLAHGKVGPGKWGKKERTGWPFKVTGPEGTIAKGNLPPGGLPAKKKTFRGAIPSCLPTRLCTRHAPRTPLWQNEKIGCVCRIHF